MKRLISLVTTLVLTFAVFAPNNINAMTTSNDMLVEELFNQRALLINENRFNELDEIDRQLATLGTYKISEQAISSLLSSKSKLSTKESALSRESYDPLVVKPEANNVSWYSSRTTLLYNGVNYEIQTLTAQPNAYSSNLKQRGNRAISSTYKWKAGSMNAIKALGAGLLGEIPGASLVSTVYSTVSSFVSGISPTTEISSAAINYSYANTTTATFKYVKKVGQSDDYQWLSYISTKCVTAIGYQYPEFSYSGGSVTPNIIQGKRTLYSTPSGYNSNLNAVKAYNSTYGLQKACVGSIQITGIESKTVSNIYPVYPEFPLHIG